MLRWVWRAGTWAVLLAALAALSVAVLVPRVAGATPYTVLSGSMRPTVEPGSLVVVKPVDARDVGVGSVVTYQLKSGEPTVVTHRVVSQGFDDKGEPVFRTQGDANDAPDDRWVLPAQIRGEVWYVVPHLGHLSNLLTGTERQMGVYLVAAVLIAYALSMFARGFRERSPRSGRGGAHVPAQRAA